MTVKFFLQWLAALGMLCAWACNRPQKDYHPEYFERYLKEFDSTLSLAKREVILDSFESALHRYPAGTGDKVKYYRAKTDHYVKTSNYTKIFLYLDSAEYLAKGRNDDPYFAGVYTSGLALKSMCYLQIKNYDAALDYLLQARNIKNSGIPCEPAYYSERMANLFFQLKQYITATGYFKKVIEGTENCDLSSYDKFVTIQGNIDNIGLCFSHAEMYDSAALYYQHALDYIAQHEPLYPQHISYIGIAKAVIKSNFAKVKLSEKFFAEAEKMMQESIAITEGAYEDFTTSSKLELANLYIEWNKLDRAERLLKELDSAYHFLQLQDSLKDRDMTWSLCMQKLWAGKGDTTKAFVYNRRYITIKDSLELLEKNNNTRDLNSELENREQQMAKAVLEQERGHKSSQLAITGLLSLIAIGIILFVWNNLRRTARQEKSQEALNTELHLRSNDLREAFVSLKQVQSENATITRMVAHDLKNPIGGIRNLLYSFIKKQQPGEIKTTLEDMSADCNASIEIINELIKGQPAKGKEDGNFSLVK